MFTWKTYLLLFTLTLQAARPLYAAIPYASNTIETPKVTPTETESSQNSSLPVKVIAQNVSLSTNAPSVSVLDPTWLENVKGQLHRLLANYNYRNAEALEILTTTWAFQADEAEDFRQIHMELILSPSEAVHYFTPIGGQWGAEWSRLSGTFFPEPDRPPFEILDMKVDLQEAVRVSKLAGFPGPWWRIIVRKLPYRDPYYAPGQMYYVFFTVTGTFHAVGGIDRIVVKNFPRLSSKDLTSN